MSLITRFQMALLALTGVMSVLRRFFWLAFILFFGFWVYCSVRYPGGKEYDQTASADSNLDGNHLRR